VLQKASQCPGLLSTTTNTIDWPDAQLEARSEEALHDDMAVTDNEEDYCRGFFRFGHNAAVIDVCNRNVVNKTVTL
jgi:hypothetical protein